MNVFARSLTDDLASLVKEVDAVVGKNSAKQAAGFVVLLTNDPDKDEARLKEFAKKHGIKHVPLTLFDGTAGPPDYKIAKEADVTVMMWRGRVVEANHVYAAGKLKPEAVQQVVADTGKILK